MKTHCLTCSAYVEHRLPVVRRLWLAETGLRLGAMAVARLLAGVHRRHQAGLPVMPGAEARR